MCGRCSRKVLVVSLHWIWTQARRLDSLLPCPKCCCSKRNGFLWLKDRSNGGQLCSESAWCKRLLLAHHTRSKRMWISLCIPSMSFALRHYSLCVREFPAYCTTEALGSSLGQSVGFLC